jgi:hypothetical protein
MGSFLTTYGISGGGAKPYLEYAWVCAPNTAKQTINAETWTTLTLNTEVADTGGHGSIASNQITLAAGTYYFEAQANHDSYGCKSVYFTLYNVSDSAKISACELNSSTGTYSSAVNTISGQFTIASSKTLDLRVLADGGTYIGLPYDATWASSTAGDSQRTTIRLWKIA